MVVDVIMIVGSKKRNHLSGFEVQSLCVIERWPINSFL